jgi:uncharacterized protein (DUF697 family)
MSTPPRKALVTRAPGDIARKLLAAFTGAISATLVIGIAGAFGVDIDPTLAASIVSVVTGVSGYFTKGSAIE